MGHDLIFIDILEQPDKERANACGVSTRNFIPNLGQFSIDFDK